MLFHYRILRRHINPEGHDPLQRNWEKRHEKIVIAATILTLFSDAVSAANLKSHDRPYTAPNGSIAAQNVKKVEAKSLYSNKELVRAGLMAEDTVDATMFPSTGRIDPPSLQD